MIASLWLRQPVGCSPGRLSRLRLGVAHDGVGGGVVAMRLFELMRPCRKPGRPTWRQQREEARCLMYGGRGCAGRGAIKARRGVPAEGFGNKVEKEGR